jgi:hypothetical protein
MTFDRCSSQTEPVAIPSSFDECPSSLRTRYFTIGNGLCYFSNLERHAYALATSLPLYVACLCQYVQYRPNRIKSMSILETMCCLVSLPYILISGWISTIQGGCLNISQVRFLRTPLTSAN